MKTLMLGIAVGAGTAFAAAAPAKSVSDMVVLVASSENELVCRTDQLRCIVTVKVFALAAGKCDVRLRAEDIKVPRTGVRPKRVVWTLIAGDANTNVGEFKFAANGVKALNPADMTNEFDDEGFDVPNASAYRWKSQHPVGTRPNVSYVVTVERTVAGGSPVACKVDPTISNTI